MDKQGKEDQMTSREDMIKKIMDSLGEDGVTSRTVLVGEAGIGKTWLANEVSKRVTKERSSSYNVLWLHLNKRIADEMSLYENLAAQLSIISKFEEGEEPDELDYSLESLKEKITKKMTENKKKNLLLILDDDESITAAEYVMKDLKLQEFLEQPKLQEFLEQHKLQEFLEQHKLQEFLKQPKLQEFLAQPKLQEFLEQHKLQEFLEQPKLQEFLEQHKLQEFLKQHKLKEFLEQHKLQEFLEQHKLQEFIEQHMTTLKILVTRRDEREEKESTIIKVGPLTEVESRKLLQDYLPKKNLLQDSKDYLLESEDWPDMLQRLCDNGEIKEATLMSCILSKSKGLPAAIVVLAKSLKNIKSLSAKQRKIFKELILSSNSLDAAAASKNARDLSRYNPVLRLSYELLKLEETVKRPVIACFWHILDFYKYAGCAYYRDLIVHWMLEGYFDPVKSVEKAYQEGHSILMEFMNRGILKIQEDNMVVPEYSMSNLLDLQDCGFFGRSCLGFDRVYGGDKKKGLGNIILIDDMIQTIQSKQKKTRTLIASGNRLRREVPRKFFERPEMQELEVVVLFEPTFEDLVKSLSKLRKLRVLVLRDCDLIKKIDELKDLHHLQVLEVSGASSLDDIPDDFFIYMTQLQSLNLSGLAIKSSPSTIEKQSMLRCFILRDCSKLQDLPNFADTNKLEVIDIRGARKLESYFDRVKDWKDYKGKNKNFAHLQQLEHLDLSETKIIRLPIFHTKDFSTMPSLTRLLLRNCTRLKRLPQLKPLTNLQILDAYGATSLVEMLEVCLEEKKELRILDISKTILPELADTIADVVNLNQLLIRNCSRIEELPSIEKLTHLEVFDVSGCDNLKKIDGSFGKMSYLHEVNLSGTNLAELPDKISELSNLKKLIIRNCSQLKALPNLEKLTHLEIFDVSGCTELEKIEGSFENMSYLHEVNLSGTNLAELPDKISELSNLKKLIIRNCSQLKALPNLEKLTHLEIFDVSGCTGLEKIEGSFENMPYLREVNLSETKLKTFPELPKQSFLCSSKRIVLADSTCLERDEWSQIKDCLTTNSEGFIFSNVAEKTREKSEKLAHHNDRYRILDPEVPLGIDIVEINRSVDLGREYIAKAEYVSIAENKSKSITSIFDEFQMRSVKGCWVERCKNMNILFESDEQQEKEKSSPASSSLETLWISNLPLLESLYCSKGGFMFKNLKKLSIDCCPRIKSLFPEIPDNLEVLRVKFCDKLERLFEVEVEVGYASKLRKLQLLDLPVLSVIGANLPNIQKWTIEKCPKLQGGPKVEEISEDQPHKTFGPETQTPAQPTKATEAV